MRSGRVSAMRGPAGVALCGLATLLIAAYTADGHTRLGLAVIGAGVAVALFMAPIRALPAIALTSVFVLPTEALPVPAYLYGFPVGIVPFVVWLVRARRGGHYSLFGWITAIGLGLWVLLSAISAPHHGHFVLLAAAAILICLVGPVLAGAQFESSEWLNRVMTRWVPLIAGFAVVEKYLLGANPLYGQLYQSGDVPLIQHWSTYRATTTIGHPLLNGTVFAVALVFALDAFLTTRPRTRFAAIRVVLLLGGLSAVVSRGAAIAAIVGAASLLLFRWGPPRLLGRKVILTMLIAVSAIVFSGSLLSRSETTEGQTSSAVRGTILADSSAAIRGNEFLGVGPAQAEVYRRQNRLPGVFPSVPHPYAGVATASTPLENAYAELAVNLGLPGLILFIMTLAASVISGLRSQRGVPTACAILAMSVSIGGYNAFDGHQQLYVLLGLLLVQMASTKPTCNRPPSGSATRRDLRVNLFNSNAVPT